MKMTIDEALETIKGERWIGCQEKYVKAMNLITDTMRKYQKIEKAYSDYLETMNPDTLADLISTII